MYNNNIKYDESVAQEKAAYDAYNRNMAEFNQAFNANMQGRVEARQMNSFQFGRSETFSTHDLAEIASLEMLHNFMSDPNTQNRMEENAQAITGIPNIKYNTTENGIYASSGRYNDTASVHHHAQPRWGS